MEFDQEKYKIYTWRNGAMLHWVINPGLAINELLLGQRVPKVSLEDRTSDKPRIERSFVPCPHCEAIHDARTWSTQNRTGFKNWFGLYCPNCGDVIPCLTNGLSFIILALTYPIWGWFRKSLKARWLTKQVRRFEGVDVKNVDNPFDGMGWVQQGLSWGIFMFILMTFIFPLLTREPITMNRILLAIPIWTIAGLGFGYYMKNFMNKKSKDSEYV